MFWTFLILTILLVCSHYFFIVYPKTLQRTDIDLNEGTELLKRIEEKKEEEARMRSALMRIVQKEIQTWNDPL